MKKDLTRILIFIFCLSASLMSMAETYPSKMYIKADWEGNGSWVWHTMTTQEDGVYTYEAAWKNNAGYNINTSKSDSESLWFKNKTIIGYDADALSADMPVVITYSASCKRLYIAPRDAASVNLMLSAVEIFTNKTFTLSAFVHNLTAPELKYSMTTPGGTEVELGTGATAEVTLTEAGTYTFTVKASPTASGQEEVSCSVSCDVSEYIAPEPCPFTPTQEELAIGYHEDVDSHDVTFIYNPATWGRSYADISTVHVSGSFNGWSAASNKDFLLNRDPEREIFYLTVPYNTVKRPGNIGQPEYKFVVNGTYTNPYSSYPSDYIFNNSGNKNMIVIFSFDNLGEVRTRINEASVIRALSDFDLTTREGREEISNYRTVPGTTMLKRCYHPFKSTSRSNMTTEPARIENVNSLAQEDGVGADICLSGDDTDNLGTYSVDGTTVTEMIPEYYQAMLAGGHVLYVGQGYSTPSYNEVYYNNRSANFGRWVGEMVDFINDPAHSGPYTIHCRLGTDRTGVFCATLAALCGASWEDVVTDYQKSNRMGINEYRSHKLLQYAFEYLLGVTSITDVDGFPEAVQQYFMDNGYLTAEDIEMLRHRLNPEEEGLENVTVATPETESPVFYNLQGIRVANPGTGLFLRRCGERVEKVLIP